MRLESVTVRGVLAFDAAVTLDLTQWPPGSVVAVVGTNGQGKTTLMETWIGALYRTFPYREKPIVDYALSRESMLEAVVRVDTHAYRARVNLDGVRRTSEAVLERDGQPVTDGKVTSFDAAVARTFPPLTVVLASAFCAQNRRGSFIELDRKGRKDLFASLLGLDQYEAWSTAARARAHAIEQARDVQAARRDEIARLVGSDVEEALAARANRLQGDTGQIDLRQREIQAALDGIAQDREVHQEAAACYAAAQTTRDRLQAEIAAQAKARARIDDQRTQLEADARHERERIATRLATADQRLDEDGRAADRACREAIAAAEQQAATTRADLETRIANNRRLLGEAATVRVAVTALEQAGARLPDARAAVEVADRAGRDLEVRRATLQGDVVALDQVTRDLDRAQRDAALLAKVPCEGAGPYAGCQFLAQAATSRASIEALEAHLASHESLRADLRAIVSEIADADLARATTAAAVTTLERTIADLKGQTKNAGQIDVAEQRIADYERQVSELAVTLAQRRTEAETQRDRVLAAFDDRRAAARVDADRARTDLDARMAARDEALAKERTALEEAMTADGEALAAAGTILAKTADAHARLQQLDGEQAAQQRAWTATEADRGRLQAEQAALERDWTALGDRRRDLDETAQRVAALEQDLVEWQSLARIFHRDGLPTLLIAAVGPEVAADTNDLLQASFGSRFVVDLVTQEAKASGKGLKETFELKIFDSARGGEARDLTDLSGGERVIVDEALKAALALYAKRHQAQPIETCVRDETTSMLDKENKGRYVPMLRRLMRLGGFTALLFVTHDEELAAYADAQVIVRDGTVRVALPPYAEAAEAA